MSTSREALEYLKINIEEWNKLTPEARKNKYHKMIIKEIFKNHPDKHPECAEGSPEHTKLVEITKLLNSINYDDGVDKVSDSQSFFTKKTNEEKKSATTTKMWLTPKNASEFIKGVKQYGYYDPKGDGRGNEYYETFKELIPNIVPWQDWHEIQDYAGLDFSLVVSQIQTKIYLEGYRGADVFVSAMVSQDKNRIKAAFDQMVSYIKNRNPFLALFASTKRQLELFIDKFCQFTPVGGKGGHINGIDAHTVLLLCQSLSLVLPYKIIDPHFDMDQELIRMSLTSYVSNTHRLALEASKTTGIPQITQ